MDRKPIPEIEGIHRERDALSRLAERERDLRAKHQAAKLRISAIASLLSPPDEMIANMRRMIDDQAASFAADQVRGLATACSAGLELQMDGGYGERKPDGSWHPGYLPSDLNFYHLCGLVPDAVKSSLERVLRTLPAELLGLPAAARRAALTEAQAVLQSIEQQHTTLVDAAGSLQPPIVMELLPEVLQRRHTEARAREREEGLRAAREPIEQAINRRGARPSNSQFGGGSTIYPDGPP